VREDLEGRNILGILPTGAGKSLCFQLPAAIADGGATIVVTPLIALMEDQDRRARERGLRATYISHTLGKGEVFVRCSDSIKQPPHLLYVAPERLISEGFADVLSRMPIRRIVVDEAHCIDQWIEYRPAYSEIGAIVESLGVPVSAFTATASRRTRNLIKASLRMEPCGAHIGSFDRPNLRYEVIKKWPRVGDHILSLLKYTTPGGAGVIYRTTRQEVEDTWRMLVANNVNCLPYHAGLQPELRSYNQGMFLTGKCNVIVATIAFGMGIDKPDIRWVIHADMPSSVEGYFQEAGRAGRDGRPATCYMLWSNGDIPKVRAFADRMENPAYREQAYDRIRCLIGYANDKKCRRRYLLRYFGEIIEPCGNCDLCGKEG